MAWFFFFLFILSSHSVFALLLSYPPFPPFSSPLPFNEKEAKEANNSLTVDDAIESWCVLQAAPARAAIYGTSFSDTVFLTVEGDIKFSIITNVTKDKNWKVFLPPIASGYEINITVKDQFSFVQLTNIIFGDVWFCAGQSNMALPLKNTLERNQSIERIMKKGEFQNIRLKQIQTNMNDKMSWQTVKQSIENGNFSQFSGVCYYFGQSLTEKLLLKERQEEERRSTSSSFFSSSFPPPSHSSSARPLGLIHTAIGGSTIGAWMKNETTDKCKNATYDNTNQQLWDTIIKKFSNYTIKGWLWYQGENNMFSLFGNSRDNTGYACLLVKLIEDWRKEWSEREASNSESERERSEKEKGSLLYAPFGLATLTPESDEGGLDIRSMGQAQTGGYGVVPNPSMPFTFLAQTFDVNDPWRNQTCDKCCGQEEIKERRSGKAERSVYDSFSSTAAAAATHLSSPLSSSPTDTPTPIPTYTPTTPAPTTQAPIFCHGCQDYCVSISETPWWFGPIHPRDKLIVGERLAQGAFATAYEEEEEATEKEEGKRKGEDKYEKEYDKSRRKYEKKKKVETDKESVTGPTLSACTLLDNFLIIDFNQSLLTKNDSVILNKNYDKKTKGSKLEVLVNASQWCFQTFREKNGTVTSVRCIDDGFGNSPNNIIDEGAAWVSVDIDAASGNQIVVDLTKSRGVAFGVRYAFQAGGDCCSENPPTSGPCPIASCPLLANISQLPANPFLAKIVKGRCSCMPPQICD